MSQFALHIRRPEFMDDGIMSSLKPAHFGHGAIWLRHDRPPDHPPRIAAHFVEPSRVFQVWADVHPHPPADWIVFMIHKLQLLLSPVWPLSTAAQCLFGYFYISRHFIGPTSTCFDCRLLFGRVYHIPHSHHTHTNTKHTHRVWINRHWQMQRI